MEEARATKEVPEVLDVQMEPEASPTEEIDSKEHLSIVAKEDGKRKRSDPVICIMCSSGDIKYRCPRCERITCSLACCLAHKKNFDCDGKRDRTKYIPMSEFKDEDISSDFFFLQEISRSTSAVHLDVDVRPPPPQKKSKKNNHKATPDTTVNPELPADYLRRFPTSVQSFVQQAKKRGVSVHLHAPGMSKHKANTSHYNSKENCVFWRVELQFVGANATITEPKWSEKRTISDIIDKHCSVSLENAPLRAKLKAFCKLDASSEWLFLLRKEFVPASSPQFYELNPSESLMANLRHLALVEFPIIQIDLQSNKDKYNIVHRAIEVIEQPASENTTSEQATTENTVVENAQETNDDKSQ